MNIIGEEYTIKVHNGTEIDAREKAKRIKTKKCKVLYNTPCGHDLEPVIEYGLCPHYSIQVPIWNVYDAYGTYLWTPNDTRPELTFMHGFSVPWHGINGMWC